MYKTKEVNKAIDVELAEQFRAEAKALALRGSNERIDELLELHRDNKGNIFCMCLDSIKYDLVKEGKITSNEFPNFGIPF